MVHGTVEVVGLALGLNLSEDVVRALEPDTEYRLREVIQEAVKFSMHARRSYLTTDDVNNALRVRNVEPQYGLGGRDPARFVRSAGHPDLYFIEDPVLDLQQLVSMPLPAAPVEAGVIPHWLAVDGKQPLIPENAPLERPRAAKRVRATAALVASGGTGAGMTAAAAAQDGTGAAGRKPGEQQESTLVRAPLRHVASQELQLYFDRVAALLSGSSPAVAGAVEAVDASGPGTEQAQRAMLASFAADPGLQPLAPHLVHLIAEQVASSLKSLPHLRLLLSAARCLVSNPHLQLASYLHQLMPAVMTCLVARRLGSSPTEDHWALRDAAARLLATICSAYSSSYTSIAPRVQFQLIKALADTSKPLSTHYGAVVGLAALGPRAVQTLLLPALQPYMTQLAAHLVHSQAQHRADARLVYGALVHAVGTCVFKHLRVRAAATQAAMNATMTCGPAAPAAAVRRHQRRQLAPSLLSRPALHASRSAAAAPHTVDWRRYFADDDDADQQEAAGKVVADARGATMRPVNAGREPAQAFHMSPTENVLLQARNEECDIDSVIEAVVTLFGRDLEPFFP